MKPVLARTVSSLGVATCGAVLLGAVLLGPVACGGQAVVASNSEAKTATIPKPIRVVVYSSEVTNRGGVIQVLVRKTRPPDFRRIEYQTIVDSLELERDPETLVWESVPAGAKVQFDVPRPGPDEALGVYFLFLEPGPDWKRLIAPDVDSVVYSLGQSGIDEEREVP